MVWLLKEIPVCGQEGWEHFVKFCHDWRVVYQLPSLHISFSGCCCQRLWREQMQPCLVQRAHWMLIFLASQLHLMQLSTLVSGTLLQTTHLAVFSQIFLIFPYFSLVAVCPLGHCPLLCWRFLGSSFIPGVIINTSYNPGWCYLWSGAILGELCPERVELPLLSGVHRKPAVANPQCWVTAPFRPTREFATREVGGVYLLA